MSGRIAMTSKPIVSLLLLLMFAGAAYLPLVNQIGYTHDDWYLMYSAGAKGSAVFWDIFGADRPWRALVMIPAYELFGVNPLYYHWNAFLFRVIGALALHTSLKMLWPERQAATTAMALLFVVYPGFLSQPNAIDYQSHIVGIASALVSAACTLKAIHSESRAQKWAFHFLSIPLGLLYLGQIEWYVGFEAFRWACLFVHSSRLGGAAFQKGARAFRLGYPSLAAPILFFIWRIFFFQSQRGATDVGVQFEQVRLYPLQTLYGWVIQLVQDFFDVAFSAWVIPFSQLTGFIQRWGGLLGIVVIVAAWAAFRQLQKDESKEGESQLDFTREALWLGLFTAIGGLIPVVLVNREVSFPLYSRYSVVSSVGVAIAIVAALARLNGRFLRDGALAGLLFISLLTHHANAVKHAGETAALNNFWRQVAWRVPHLETNTTLIANYPAVATEEDYFVWGPANLIYHPESQNEDALQPALFAAILNRDTVNRVLTRERQEYDNRRTIITYKNYRNVLILTQPSSNSCVHILNGLQPEFSNAESDSIRVIGSYSEIEHVLADETPHALPEIVFGPEPPRGWCYYYQKADLARQRGDWESIVGLGKEAQASGLSPSDAIEWMPFLQAYAVTNNVNRLLELAPVIGADPYVSAQACNILGAMDEISDSVAGIVDAHYCPE